MTDTIAEARLWLAAPFENGGMIRSISLVHALIALAERGSTQDMVDERNEYQSRWLASEGDKARLKEQLAEQRGVVMPEEPTDDMVHLVRHATSCLYKEAQEAIIALRAHLLAQQGEKVECASPRVSPPAESELARGIEKAMAQWDRPKTPEQYEALQKAITGDPRGEANSTLAKPAPKGWRISWEVGGSREYLGDSEWRITDQINRLLLSRVAFKVEPL